MPRAIRSFTFDQEVSQWIDEEAEKAGISRSEFMNKLTTEKMEKVKLAEAVTYAGIGSAALGCIFLVAMAIIPVIP